MRGVNAFTACALRVPAAIVAPGMATVVLATAPQRHVLRQGARGRVLAG